MTQPYQPPQQAPKPPLSTGRLALYLTLGIAGLCVLAVLAFLGIYYAFMPARAPVPPRSSSAPSSTVPR
ncbi:MAG: hypothetical protein IPK82_38220 [Polyangiaceae bacterium]|nr:hypothetical protein [Polyangiaceae bacterium]